MNRRHLYAPAFDIDDEADMAFSNSDDKQATNTDELMALLNRLPAGTTLFLEPEAGELLPILTVGQNSEKPLQLGRQGMSDALDALSDGKECRLVARAQEPSLAVVPPSVPLDKKSPPLGIVEAREGDENRRLVFRSELCLSMRVDVLLRIGEGTETHKVQARLNNLSIGGCLVEMPLQAQEILPAGESMVEVSLCFPDATQFAVNAWLSHATYDKKRQLLTAGLRFHTSSSKQDSKLWYFVREIEREAARSSGQSRRQPSPLFEIS